MADVGHSFADCVDDDDDDGEKEEEDEFSELKVFIKYSCV